MGPTEKIHEIRIDFYPQKAVTALPVLLYKNVLTIPFLFPASQLGKLFAKQGWKHNWEGRLSASPVLGDHHEVIGVYAGATTIALGGRKGRFVMLNKGDVLIVPAGVDRKTIDRPDTARFVGGFFPQCAEPWMINDPVGGANDGIRQFWKTHYLLNAS